MSARDWNQKSEYIRSAKPRAAYLVVKLVEDEPKRYRTALGLWTTMRSAAEHFGVKEDAVDSLIVERDAAGKRPPRMRVERIIVDVDPVQAAARRVG